MALIYLRFSIWLLLE